MKLIRFFSENNPLGLGKPVPAKTRIPEWYRLAESTYTDSEGNVMAGLKKCMPYMDSLVSGYMLTLPVDIYVTRNEDGTANFRWNGPDSFSSFVNQRPDESGATMPRPAGHDNAHLIWSGMWNIKTPRGWSVLVSHPFNRFDLPFTTVTALMDSDEMWSAGNIPFFIKSDFTGVIPQGTPIAQLLPIKRASWKMVGNDFAQKGEAKQLSAIVRSDDTPYKKIMWHRKKYD